MRESNKASSPQEARPKAGRGLTDQDFLHTTSASVVKLCKHFLPVRLANHLRTAWPKVKRSPQHACFTLLNIVGQTIDAHRWLHLFGVQAAVSGASDVEGRRRHPSLAERRFLSRQALPRNTSTSTSTSTSGASIIFSRSRSTERQQQIKEPASRQLCCHAVLCVS